MSRVTLLTGGARSGKSTRALTLAQAYPAPRGFVATAQALDDEMRRRIDAHQRERGAGWVTVEEPRDLAGALRGLAGQVSVAVVDCLTLWLSNLLHHPAPGEQAPADALDATGQGHIDALLALVEDPPLPLICVTNESGMGIVPMNPLARQFRDLAGHVNQQVASRADRVTLLVCGQPLCVKGGDA